MSNSITDNAHPEEIGRYKILGLIGSGASAEVYRAYDPHLERKLAIKLLRRSQVQDDAFRKSFIQEGRILAKLVHPGIVTIFDVGVFDKKLYIVMELMEGFTLETILKTLGKLTIPSVIEMALQLTRALHYAHEMGVIHRDIKPANIVVLRDNKTVKLADFGIARFDKHTSPLVQATDKVTGTPKYMAPEQVMGKTTDHRTDLYSLGVLFYQMVNGSPPFTNDNLGLLFQKVIHEPADMLPLQDKLADQPQAMEIIRVIRQLLEKDPDRRFQKAADLTIKLQQISNKLVEGRTTESDDLVDDNIQSESIEPGGRTRSVWGWVTAVCLVLGLAGLAAYMFLAK